MAQPDGLVESGNTVLVVEHELKVVAASDWVIDVGDDGGRIGDPRGSGPGVIQPDRPLPRPFAGRFPDHSTLDAGLLDARVTRQPFSSPWPDRCLLQGG